MATKGGRKPADTKQEKNIKNKEEMKNAWLKYTASDRKKLDELCNGYLRVQDGA